jgi:phage tail sheath gpL-like
MADTFSLALTGLDATNPIPGIYAEVRFAQGPGADLGPRRVLILAPKTASGAITPDTAIVQIQDEADAIQQAGAGSPAHRMARAFFANNKSSEVWLLCPAAASGSAATDRIVIATTATANGVLSVWICGEQIDVPIITGDTATVIGDALAVAINARTHLPVTASNAAGTVSVTGKIAGTDLNSVRFRARITGTGIGTTVTPTADTALGSSGAGGAAIGVGVISYTSALATLLPRKFDVILAGTQEATPLDALMDQVTVQAEPSTGFRQKVYAASCLSPASSATLASGASLNRERADLINAEECPVEHYALCAIVAGRYLTHNGADPSYSFDGYGTRAGQILVGLSRPFNDSALPTTTELRTMLNSGVTPIAYTESGAPYIVRAVTTRCRQGSNPDYRVRDAHIVTVADRFTAELVARIAAAPWTKVTRDPVGNRPEPGAEFCTPRRMKALIEQVLDLYAAAGWIDPARLDETIAATVVGQDPLVPSRLNTSVPLYAAVLLHQHALLVKESSAAA